MPIKILPILSICEKLDWCYYRPQRSCGQGNVFTGVCLSTGGEDVCLSACWDAIPPRDQADPPGTRHTPRQDQAHTPGPGTPPRTGRPPRDQAHPPGPGRPPQDQAHPPKTRQTPQTRQTPLGPGRHHTPPRTRQTPPGSRLQHTVYERPVRILLECILVGQVMNQTLG